MAPLFGRDTRLLSLRASAFSRSTPSASDGGLDDGRREEFGCRREKCGAVQSSIGGCWHGRQGTGRHTVGRWDSGDALFAAAGRTSPTRRRLIGPRRQPPCRRSFRQGLLTHTGDDGHVAAPTMPHAAICYSLLFSVWAVKTTTRPAVSLPASRATDTQTATAERKAFPPKSSRWPDNLRRTQPLPPLDVGSLALLVAHGIHELIGQRALFWQPRDHLLRTGPGPCTPGALACMCRRSLFAHCRRPLASPLHSVPRHWFLRSPLPPRGNPRTPLERSR